MVIYSVILQRMHRKKGGSVHSTVLSTVTYLLLCHSLSITQAIELPCSCATVQYRIQFINNWSKNTHTKDYPDKVKGLIHWSNIVGSSHSREYVLWRYGQLASLGVKNVCEYGLTTTVENDMANMAGEIKEVFKLAGIWFRDPVGLNQERVTLVPVDDEHPLLSAITMVGPSPDWCVGVDSLSLRFSNCTWVDSLKVPLYPWDSGTDSGFSFLSPDEPTLPPLPISKINHTHPPTSKNPFFGPFPMDPLAWLVVVRENVEERSCSAPAERGEDETCDVSAWSYWGQCSSTCGFGKRNRQRQLVVKDNDPACVNKKLEETMPCVGLPGFRTNCELPSDVCSVTNWSEWSPCSASCGAGTQTRLRQHMRDGDSLQSCGRELTEIVTCTAPILDCELYYARKNYTAICSTNSDEGPCRGTFTRFYYDARDRKCKTFTYGGCRGNENRFATEDECMKWCGNAIQKKENEQKKHGNKNDCQASGWTKWSDCSATCGVGIKIRRREIIKGDTDCQKLVEKIRPCPLEPCEGVSLCTFTGWSEWTKCNRITCVQERMRDSPDPNCGREIQRQHCYDGPCDIFRLL